ncbi:MAG: aminotransferase class III-fold pyridoxal phosphate-dependent enzyme [Bacteroidetes Order II. Incertae sedis bacterium]|jgi:4-aminobutyrate aminotransferase-like enzyme/Ser/Thr protein kinase RdoA (MazF antagonist)|nr:aminotransferase class III-fold pyridoxal phosphate-dependent enzyme [Bacteroidetes Order II. bacterium]MBT5250244.1 aminotransferase class III-fold pyridoxal phosphate-dependent enzyme [Bacteroidetes Order II. bacterium]MBT6200839.1 aminotransferase class III-fold pyridoxal phosphate-dependent enzyme [Bacteroidetes Order II. bacterium]MBT6581304.1 aminotransferase class III-fold pyridoxal phosphate-dependent enzyme [Bacteroidetes Order II. bacterium]MBT7400660.1 aminotransferase class III-f
MSKMPGRPVLTVPEAEALALELFGAAGTAAPLPSDRDLNFRLTLTDGSRAVFKIFNTIEDEAYLECQSDAMDWAAKAGLPVPKVIGRATAKLKGKNHLVRLVSWLDGTPLGDASPITAQMEFDLGALLGRMDRAMEGFEHPAAPNHFPWDFANVADTVSKHIHAIPEARKPLVEMGLNLYHEHVAPKWDVLPKAIIHNDANDYNVLVGSAQEYPRPITGLLDFGDLVHSARVGNPAVAATYLALHREDPVDALCQVIKGYTSIFELSELELEVFYSLVCIRLSVSVTMSAVQRALEPDNEYLSISEKGAWAALEKLQHQHPRLVHYRLRDAAGYAPVPNSTLVVDWVRSHKDDFHPVILPARPGAPPVVFDFSVSSQEFDSEAINTPGVADKEIWDRTGNAVGIGRWDEPRLAYGGDQYATQSGERRTIHLGVDLFRPAGTPVQAPLSGTVHSFCAHHARFDYGGCLILEHEPEKGLRFWTLYGHLSHDSVKNLVVGKSVEAGDVVAYLGPFEENGGWVPHLHFQIIVDRLDLEATFPGVASPSQRDVWCSLSPSPVDMLGIPQSAVAPRSPHVQDLLERRNRSISSALSVSYDRKLHIVRGWMQYLYDAEGHAYLDAVNNVPHVGHSNPRVVKALHRQMRTLTTNTRYLHETILDFSERLVATLPESLEVCFFVNSGSEANDLALRLARAATGKQDTVVLEGGYHGNSTSLIGISPYKFDGHGGKGRPATTHVVPMPDSYRGPFKGMTAETGAAYARFVESAVAQGTCAAFIAESVPGVGGQIVPPPHYLRAAAEHVRKAGAVFIADEVQVGMGRPGSTFWGFELDDVIPDIVVMGKPIGNGHPLGVVVTTRAIANAFDNGMEYFNTFGGNPASCAVGLAVLNEVRDQHLQQNALEVGTHLLSGLAKLAQRHAIIGDVRGVGLFIGLELVRNHEDLEPADVEASYVANRMRDKGILISTDGPLHNVLKIKPPMVFTREDADFLTQTLDAILCQDFVTARLRK